MQKKTSDWLTSLAVIEHRFKNGSVLRVSAHSLESMTMALTNIWRLNGETSQGGSTEQLREPKQATVSPGAHEQVRRPRLPTHRAWKLIIFSTGSQPSKAWMKGATPSKAAGSGDYPPR